MIRKRPGTVERRVDPPSGIRTPMVRENSVGVTV